MRRLLPALSALALIMITACQAPIIPSTLTPTSKRTNQPATSTTGRPTLSPTASIDFDAVFRQLADQLGHGPYLELGMTEDISRGLAAFLNTKADRRQTIDRQPTVIDELRSVLSRSSSGKPNLTISDADGDGRLDVLVTLPARGLPGFVIRQAPDGFISYQIPKPASMLADGIITFDRVDDLNGDGVPELALTTQILGASAVNTLITIARWDGQAFKTLLQTGVSDWAGPAGWEFVKEDSTEALVTRCPALGAYDHKLLPHPQLTRTFRWQAGSLILDQTALAPPETVRQQVNLAESAFRKGRLDQALAAYQRAVDDTNLAREPETAQVAWRAYAQFRIGEIEALQGNMDAAQAAMEKAKAAGPSLSDLATAFLEGYANGSAARGLAAMQRVNLPERFYFEKGGNLGFPMDAAGVLYPGLAAAAYLNTHPDAGRGSGEALTGMLRDLGLSVASSAIVDLDSDGRPEVLVVLNQALPKELAPDGQRQTLWLLTWGEAGWWPQEIETDSSLVLTQTVPVPDHGRRAVVYQRPENTSPRDGAISWDGAQVVRYNLPDGEELVPVAGNSDPFQCTIP